jgi:hypothetical protein
MVAAATPKKSGQRHQSRPLFKYFSNRSSYAPGRSLASNYPSASGRRRTRLADVAARSAFARDSAKKDRARLDQSSRHRRRRAQEGAAMNAPSSPRPLVIFIIAGDKRTRWGGYETFKAAKTQATKLRRHGMNAVVKQIPSCNAQILQFRPPARLKPSAEYRLRLRPSSHDPEAA